MFQQYNRHTRANWIWGRITRFPYLMHLGWCSSDFCGFDANNSIPQQEHMAIVIWINYVIDLMLIMSGMSFWCTIWSKSQKHAKVAKRHKVTGSVQFSNAASGCRRMCRIELLWYKIIRTVNLCPWPTCKTSCKKVTSKKCRKWLLAEVAA